MVSFAPLTPDRFATPAKMEISLTEVEAKLCTLLDEYVQHLENRNGTRTSCRIAGGWVRDKVRYGHYYLGQA